MNRRDFLSASSAAGFALSAGARPSAAQSPGASDKIQVGVIGPGGRGTQVMKECIEFGSIYNASVTAVCDIWTERLESAAQVVAESYGTRPKAFGRYEDMLADAEIDAVIIATPDHQHAKMLKAAVEAGKDVYCEKPMGNVLSETNDAMDAVKRTGRIVQIGTQRRSYPRYRSAMEIVQGGMIGDIVNADVIWNAYSPNRWAREQEDLDSLKESDVDWEAFLMGKSHRPFDPRVYRSFRLFRDFSSAIIDQWMTHGVDVIHMLTGEPYPTRVVAHGGIYHFHDYRENPDNVQVALEYGRGPEKFLANYSTCLYNSAGSATRVMGTLGTVEVEDVWRVSGKGSEHSDALPGVEEIPEKPGTLHHMANWLDAVRRRDGAGLYAPVEAGYGHSIACIMATDALWSGTRRAFDPATRTIVDG